MDVSAKDKRFADPTWEHNGTYWLLRQQLLLERLVGELVAGAGLDPAARAKTDFLVRQLTDTLAPPTPCWAIPPR